MLGHAEGEGIDPHLAGALPLAATGVVAGALELNVPRPEVTNRVAANQDGLLPCPRTNRPVERSDDLGGGLGVVGEGPAIGGDRACHLKAPAPGDIPGGEVVLDEVVAPVAEPLDIRHHEGQHLRHTRIEEDPPLLAREPPALRNALVAGEQGPNPDTGAHPKRRHPRREAGQVGEAVVAVGVGATIAALSRKPPGIDHHVGRVVAARGELSDQRGIAADAGVAVVAVGVVPVVATVDHVVRKARRGAEGLAERARGPGVEDNRRRVQHAVSQVHALAPGAQVQHERDAFLIELPVRDTGRAGLDTKAMGLARGGVEEEGVPRQDALGDIAAPLQVAVAPLPVVAQHPCAGGQGLVPAERERAQRGCGTCHTHRAIGQEVHRGRVVIAPCIGGELNTVRRRESHGVHYTSYKSARGCKTSGFTRQNRPSSVPNRFRLRRPGTPWGIAL